MSGRTTRALVRFPNPLKGALGDALHAVLCGAGHNIRLLPRKQRLLCARMAALIHSLLKPRKR